MHHITKRFPGVIANDSVSLTLRAGEVHALLGENGAGKTTLISILYGLYNPDEGEIRVRGEEVHFRSPKDAIRSGLGLIAQHFMLVKRHTVAENIALGLERTPFFFPLRKLKTQIGELGERYGLGVDPDAYINELSAGEQQRVEILKALVRGAKVLIMDEPTGVLTPQEAQNLFEVLARMKRAGHAVIFITHKLSEVLEIADRITVLRKGAVVGSLGREEADEKTLARLMVGREVASVRLERDAQREVAGVVLEADTLTARSERGAAALKGVSFRVGRGEILGVAGVAGNGQSELIEVVTGHRTLERGQLTLAGQDVTALSARQRFERGVAHIPEDRSGVGVVPTLSVAENLALRHYRYAPFAQGPLLNPRAVADFATRSIGTYDIATPSQHTATRLLSGGNIQKLILARELSNLSERSDAALIVASHPTYGLDVGAAAQVHRALLKERARGSGVLLVSEDLEELLGLADRIMVMFAGETMGTLSGEHAQREQLGLMMAGVNA